MKEIICDICETAFFLKDSYSEGKCPQCGLEYNYNEDIMPVISDVHWGILKNNHQKSEKINQERLDILIDIFEHHEQPEKIQIILKHDTRCVEIKIDDLDDEWFAELCDADREAEK